MDLQLISTEKELSKVTGLSHEELWDKGFDLDDWDVCFKANKPIKNKWLLSTMSNYCCGYELVEYNKSFYYLVYHA